jgi:microcystin-dependent protein
MSFFRWSKTANANATADGTINWAEGQAPSTVNDSARAMMAAAAKYRDDVAGIITTGGTSTAYTLTSNQGFDSLANMSGKMVALVPHATSGVTVTLNVDGLGAKPLRSAPSVDLSAGVLIAGTPYCAVYNNSTAEWILQGFYGPDDYSIPLAGGLPYFGSSAPNSKFAFPSGQTLSRTAYAGLFALIGTTYGVGDGSTTFNLPSLGGRLLACRENMNGAGAEGRITSAGSGITGTTLGATGGAQNITLDTTTIPSHAHSVSGSTGGQSVDHSHGYSGSTSSDGSHAHGITGGSALVDNHSGGLNVTSSGPYGTTSPSIDFAGLHSHTYGGNTGGVSVDHSHGFSVSSANTGGGGAHNNMPPTMMVNFIMRVL